MPGTGIPLRRLHGAAPRAGRRNEDSPAAVFEPLESRLCFTVPNGPDVPLNATTAGIQETVGPPAIATDSLGNLVIAWESYNQSFPLTWGVYGRRFDAALSPQGGEVAAGGTLPLDDQRRPRVARAPSGGYVVVWDGAGLLGALPSIYAQRYDAGGVAQGATITVAAGTAVQARSNASVAMDQTGGFVVVWESSSQDALLTQGVYARIYNADGTPRSAEFTVNQTAAGDQTEPVVAVDSSGRFVVAWSGQGAGDSAGVFYRAFSSGGAALTGERLANTASTAGTQAQPAIAATPAGGFVLAWSGSGTGDASGIFAQRLDPLLSPVGGEMPINNQTAGTQSLPAIAADPDGDFVVAWSGQGASDADGVYVREFAADGTARAGQLIVNATTAGAQATPSILSQGDNTYVVVWSGAGPGDPDGVFARRLTDIPPSVTTTVSALLYTEGDGPVPIDPGLLLADPDDEVLSGASVTISASYAPGQDVLSFTDQPGITGAWSPATGVLTLSGAATVAAYQAALRSVAYSNASENPSTLQRTVTFTVDDGAAAGAGSRSIAVAGVNDAPIVVTTASPLGYTENAGMLAVDPSLLISDPDSPLLVGATVAITGNYAAGEDVLGFVDQAGISGSWNPLTGTLTLTGAAALAAYISALRSVTYLNTSENPSTAVRTVSFSVSDGSASSVPAVRSIAVTAVNDPPGVSTTAPPLAYTENDGQIAVDPALTISDPDSAVLTGATVAIASNYVAGEDSLWFVDQAGIVGVWNQAAGVLTLSGVAALAAYQAALRSVAYLNSSENPSTAARTISFVVTDGSDASSPAARAVVITAAEDPPVITTTGTALIYSEGSGPVPVDAALMIADPDSPLLFGATVSILGNYVIAQDSLAFVNQAGITGSWNPLTGVLTLSGAATLAAYQAALRSVTYTNSSQNPVPLARTVSFVVRDGTGPGGPATRSIAVGAINDPPVVVTTAAPLGYSENTGPVAFDPSLTVSDPDSPFLTGASIAISGNYAMGEDRLTFANQAGIVGTWNALTGVLTLSGLATAAAYQAALRSITYLNSSENPSVLPRTLTVLVSDGLSASMPASRIINLFAVDDPPSITVSAIPLLYVEGQAPTPIDAALTVSDPDSPVLTAATATISGNYAIGQDVLSLSSQAGLNASWNPLTGVLTITGAAPVAAYQAALRAVTYSNASRNPSRLVRTISFAAWDGTSLSVPAARDITVLTVNDPPLVLTTATPLLYTENAGLTPVDPGLLLADLDNTTLAGATVQILANYRADQDLLLFAGGLGVIGSWDPLTGILTLHGTATLAAYQAALRSVAYSNSSENPDPSPRTISFTVTDGTDPSLPAVRTVLVLPVNDPPLVVTSAGSTLYMESSPGVQIDLGILVIDPDSAALTGARVAISSGFAAGDDALGFTPQPGIVGDWEPQTGILTLTGIASAATYQALLRSVTYTNFSRNPSPLSRTVSFALSDEMDWSAPASRGIVIVPVNDLPHLTAGASQRRYTENDAAAPLDAGLTLDDPDSPMMVGATVRILERYARGQDELGFVDTGGITGRWDPQAGALTLSGRATVAAYQTALRSITYFDASDDPDTADRTIGIAVDDGEGSGGITELLLVTAVNDAPWVTASDSAAVYTESGPAVPVDPGLTLADPDSTMLVGATVAIASRYQRGQDRLAFSGRAGITGSWDDQAGVLMLVGTATVAEYQAALRSVVYVNTASQPGTEARSVRFTADDGQGTGAASTLVRIVDLPTPPPPPPPEPPPGPPPQPPGPPTVPPVVPPVPPGAPPPVPPTPPTVPPVDPPPTPPGTPVPPTVPPADPPTQPPTPTPPPPETPVPVPVPGPLPNPQAATAQAGATPPARGAASSAQERARGILQVIQLASGNGIVSPSLSTADISRRLTIALVQASSAFLAGYAAWLLISYSLTRHSLFVLPNFDPMDLHCLLRAGRCSAARAR